MVINASSWQENSYKQKLTYSSNFCSPRNNNGIWYCRRQSDKWGDINWSARSLWFHTVFSRWKVTLRKKYNLFLLFPQLFQFLKTTRTTTKKKPYKVWARKYQCFHWKVGKQTFISYLGNDFSKQPNSLILASLRKNVIEIQSLLNLRIRMSS